MGREEFVCRRLEPKQCQRKTSVIVSKGHAVAGRGSRAHGKWEHRKNPKDKV